MESFQYDPGMTYAVGALSKSIYERMFKWPVARINRALDAKLSGQFFIGILDITGFEILDENLSKLMTNLKSTAPHFVRCINPNVNKMPGIMDPYLVLQQLHCNGALEGIRICREGFPNQLLYADVKQRYCILNLKACPRSKFMSSRKAAEELLGSLEIDHTQYRLGITKMFSKAGFLGQLEAMKDERLSKVFPLFQARGPGKLMQIKFQRILAERDILLLIQWNIRAFMAVKDWPWMRLFFKIKPLVKSARMGKEVVGLKEECVQLQTALEKSKSKKEELKAKQVSLIWEKNDLLLQLQALLATIFSSSWQEQETLANVEEQCESLIKSKIQLEAKVKALSVWVEEEEEINSELTARGRKLEDECSELKKEIDDLETIFAKSEKEKHAAEHRNGQALQEAHRQTRDDLNTEEEKLSNLSKAKLKLEQHVDLGALEQERKAKMNCEREKLKLEGELKLNQESLAYLESSQLQLAEKLRKKELETSQMNSKGEKEKDLVAQLQKMVKEFQIIIYQTPKRHADSLAELEGQVEDLQQVKQKLGKDKSDLQLEMDDLLSHVEQMTRAKLINIPQTSL
ncbi:hypothetical protein mRhiFer1_011460 [Rhinolophus ferrumequinum]|uniref:Myosin motor domain-containing protein n=1 Tax=Rhinolophus ferrumequinum TaxID=59479 RepID=A0A7J8AFM1_RHIFE|nr:hypothetical protein mRhiFer1_011460 [Rhinolophus ferrumequinum]